MLSGDRSRLSSAVGVLAGVEPGAIVFDHTVDGDVLGDDYLVGRLATTPDTPELDGG
jgi:hypothetical protein